MKREVLDHGSVELLDFMGSDSMILETARVCTDEPSNPKRDAGLMQFLIRNDHLTPLESCVFRFKVKAPIFVARQWVKHRMSSWNEKSMRYTEARDLEMIQPDWRKESSVRGMTEPVGEICYGHSDYIVERAYEESKVHYNELLELGVAKEHARTVLPVGSYTEWIWTVNLRSLANYLTLRTSDHAQKEIRVYAEAILELIKETGEFPNAIETIEGMIQVDRAVLRLLNHVKDPKIGATMINELVDKLKNATEEK